ncbi:hypothetical protein E2C01_087297 [Portunus trituberculatus]|uniref:Uncharacterized protein n=1 Tax=Portunus trituberculatus TaxID=210409 RepID=A0A5B7J7S1_PORTR|nr:hypothetical protein [Portunus trituberculatus]
MLHRDYHATSTKHRPSSTTTFLVPKRCAPLCFITTHPPPYNPTSPPLYLFTSTNSFPPSTRHPDPLTPLPSSALRNTQVTIQPLRTTVPNLPQPSTKYF